MKNVNLFLLLSFFMTGFFSCTTIDPDTGIVTEIDYNIEIINSNAMAAGENWVDVKEFDLREQMRESYGIDLSKNELLTFEISNLFINVNAEQCRKLSKADFTISLPNIPLIEQSASGSSLDAACDFGSFIAIPDNAGNTYGIIGNDFAEAITNGGTLKIGYDLTAGEDMENSAGLNFAMVIKTSYRPKK